MKVFSANGHVKMDLVSAAETPTVHCIKYCDEWHSWLQSVTATLWHCTNN